MKKKYNIGDYVFVSRYRREQVIKPCSVCFSKRVVTLILGDGSKMELPCDYCRKGYESPTGLETSYEFLTYAEKAKITKVEQAETEEGVSVEYRSSHHVLYECDIFDTENEALESAKEKRATAIKEEETRSRYIKKNQNKTYSWNAGYHLKCVSRAKKDMEYHSKMAKICKEKGVKK